MDNLDLMERRLNKKYLTSLSIISPQVLRSSTGPLALVWPLKLAGLRSVYGTCEGTNRLLNSRDDENVVYLQDHKNVFALETLQ